MLNERKNFIWFLGLDKKSRKKLRTVDWINCMSIQSSAEDCGIYEDIFESQVDKNLIKNVSPLFPVLGFEQGFGKRLANLAINCEKSEFLTGDSSSVEFALISSKKKLVHCLSEVEKSSLYHEKIFELRELISGSQYNEIVIVSDDHDLYLDDDIAPLSKKVNAASILGWFR